MVTKCHARYAAALLKAMLEQTPKQSNMLPFQVLFGPQRCDGIGLSDGETMERLWSYLRKFARMTREMSSHHLHVLTSALIYYGIETKDKLGMSMDISTVIYYFVKWVVLFPHSIITSYATGN